MILLTLQDLEIKRLYSEKKNHVLLTLINNRAAYTQS